MDIQEKSGFKKAMSIAYQIYHFVAKVFLYSILIILLLVAVGVAAYVVDLVHNINNGETKYPLLSAYIIVTPSMVPTINVEDAIVVLRKEPEEFKKKDIITFTSSDPRYSGLTITHRIVGIEKLNGVTYFRTKGDNNNVEDAALVPASSVYGKVVLKIPMIGYIQYILMQSYGWIILVVIPCLGIIIYDIYKLIKSVAVPTSRKKEVVENKNNKNMKNLKYKNRKGNNNVNSKKSKNKKERMDNEII